MQYLIPLRGEAVMNAVHVINTRYDLIKYAKFVTVMYYASMMIDKYRQIYRVYHISHVMSIPTYIKTKFEGWDGESHHSFAS